jgi:2-octaprenyl-6-methoxyphenol hydroxylase
MTAPIAVLGGGPTGLACALLLARRGRASVVFDARPLEPAQADRRLLALSRGTWQILAPLAAPPPRAPIRDVFVSSAGEFGATHIGAADFDGDDLGATAFYGDLVAALAAAAAAEPKIEVRRPQRVVELQQTPAAVRVVCAAGETLEAPLAINAEGFSADAGATTTDDEAVALIGEARIAGPSADSAFERFTREGPLALLPSPAASAPVFALVWCMSAAAAERRLALPAEALRAELQRALGARIGRVESIGPQHAVKLHQSLRDEVIAHRCVAIGNAAQTLHPVAGQGFNLALRDAATLIDCVADSDDIPAALARYAERRRADRAAIAAVTRWLPRIFATRFAPIAVARALGLTALDLAAPLRRELTALLMFGVRA